MEEGSVTTEMGQDNFFKSEDLNIKQIILRHIRKISDLASEELTPSYWEKVPSNLGTGVFIVEKYHEDKREAYCGAIDFLLDIVMPYVDEEFKDILKGINEVEEEAFNLAETEKYSKDRWIKEKVKFRRHLLAEIFLMLERINYFGEEAYTE